MGLRDAEEMLEAAQRQSIADEREIARLQAELAAATTLIADQEQRLHEQASVIFQAGEQHGILWRERHALEQRLDRVRAVAREHLDDVGEQGALADEFLQIVGTQAAPSGDEHDRHA